LPNPIYLQPLGIGRYEPKIHLRHYW